MLRTGKTPHYGAMLRMSPRTCRIMAARLRPAALFVRSNSYRGATLAKLADLTPKTISV
jgi:hypothetical protein